MYDILQHGSARHLLLSVVLVTVGWACGSGSTTAADVTGSVASAEHHDGAPPSTASGGGGGETGSWDHGDDRDDDHDRDDGDDDDHHHGGSATDPGSGSATPPGCTAKTCADLGATCGTVSDGCGHMLACGTCAANETCGAAAPNVCGVGACVPTTCAAAGKNCGSIPDGCGGTLACGSCAAGMTCGVATANVCGTPACVPTTCAAKGATCGTLPDGCGGVLTCGTCAANETCGGGGKANVCGAATPAACSAGAWNSFAHNTFSVNCTACHSAYDTYANVKTDASKIRSAIASGAMPKGRTMAPADKTQILQWLDCGAPQ